MNTQHEQHENELLNLNKSAVELPNLEELWISHLELDDFIKLFSCLFAI